jgi:hypothetical protein
MTKLPLATDMRKIVETVVSIIPDLNMTYFNNCTMQMDEYYQQCLSVQSASNVEAVISNDNNDNIMDDDDDFDCHRCKLIDGTIHDEGW